jgi:integrase
MAATQRVLIDGSVTWTVVAASHVVIGPAEQYLEYTRQTGFRSNTVRAYARGLALWWSYLEQVGKAWDAVAISDFGAFLAAVRADDFDPVVRPIRPTGSVRSESTVALRLRAVMGFYRYQAALGVDAAPFWYEQVRTRTAGRYVGFLDHLSHRQVTQRPTIRIGARRGELPLLTPEQIDVLVAAEATFCSASGEWLGDLRYRLLWTLLAETGLRIGEALALQHRDWDPARGTTASVAVVDRPHPFGLSVKSGPRRVFIGSRLDRLYGDYVWWLCDRGADAAVNDWDSAYIFCNIKREPMFGPLRPESVYDHLYSMKRRVPGLPKKLSPHWFRHTHATALLLAGSPLHVVSRRLGHRDVQTTLNTYGHVTQDAELAALANWRDVVAGWEGKSDA